MAGLVYKFSNLLDSPYQGGAFCFSAAAGSQDNDAFLCIPSGNRVLVKDLVDGLSMCLPVEARQDVTHVCVTPNRHMAVVADSSGMLILVNLCRNVELQRMGLRYKVTSMTFNETGDILAVATSDHMITLWRMPCLNSSWMLDKINAHKVQSRVRNLQFQGDYLVAALKEGSIIMFAMPWVLNFTKTILLGHRHSVEFAGLDKSKERIISVGVTGRVIVYKFEKKGEVEDRILGFKKEPLDKLREKQIAGHFGVNYDDSQNGSSRVKRMRQSEVAYESEFSESKGVWVEESLVHLAEMKGSHITSCDFNLEKNLLLIGQSNGIFAIYEMPSMDAIARLSLSSHALTHVRFSNDAEWVAIGSQMSSQVVVWAWRAERYVLKERGEAFGITAVAFMTSGIVNPVSLKHQTKAGPVDFGLGTRNIIATGSANGKVKLWDGNSGYCFMTFQFHTAAITGLTFTPQGNALASSSLDGTVRLVDLMRYRNFRTLSAPPPEPVQFTSVSIDASGELITACGSGSNTVLFVWSIQTGSLLETLEGHEDVVTCVRFCDSPLSPGLIASCSLDGTLRVTNLYGRQGKGGATQILKSPTSGASCLAWKPLSSASSSGAQTVIAVSLMKGAIEFWDIEEEEIIGTIEAARDMGVGRAIGQKFAADGDVNSSKYDKSVNRNHSFSTMEFSKDGELLLCGTERSPRICVFSSSAYQLLYSFNITSNRSIDGLVRHLNSKYLTEAGVDIREFEVSDSEDLEDNDIRKRKRLEQGLALPGQKFGEFAAAAERRTLHVAQLALNSDCSTCAVATNHGVFIFDSFALSGSLNRQGGFTFSKSNQLSLPSTLTLGATVDELEKALELQQLAKALRIALSLQNQKLIQRVYEMIPQFQISNVLKALPEQLTSVLLAFIAESLRKPANPNVGILLSLHLKWLQALFRERKFSQNSRSLMLTILRTLQEMKENYSEVMQNNLHTCLFLCA